MDLNVLGKVAIPVQIVVDLQDMVGRHNLFVVDLLDRVVSALFKMFFCLFGLIKDLKWRIPCYITQKGVGSNSHKI